MNWYKRASWAIQLHEQFYAQSKIFAQKIIEIFKKLRTFYNKNKRLPKWPKFVGKIIFPDIKTNNIFRFNIYVNDVFVFNINESFYIVGTNNIFFNVPVSIQDNRTTDEILDGMLNKINSGLIHEITHAVDEKPDDIKIKMNPKNVEHQIKPIEFDSFSRQIIDEIKNSYKLGNDEDRANIILWMKNFYRYSRRTIPANIKKSLKLTDSILGVLDEWKMYDFRRNLKGMPGRKWMERFMVRLYNEFYNMDDRNNFGEKDENNPK